MRALIMAQVRGGDLSLRHGSASRAGCVRTSGAVATGHRARVNTQEPRSYPMVPQRSVQMANTAPAPWRLAKSVFPSGLKQAPAHSLPSCPG